MKMAQENMGKHTSVSVHDISMSYPGIKALDHVSFDINEGELFGLIGPDGAGKTTLFRILTTLIVPQEGNATVESLDTVKDFREIRDIVGYMPGKFSLYQDLSVQENLDFFANVFNTTIQENYHLVKDIYVQIEPFKKRKAGKLSGGMKQKLALCCALIHKPKVLFLDEPTTGVDPVSRKEFWEMLKRLKQQGITILVSTPYMDEAGLCDRIALIQSGKIMAIDTPEGIINDYEKDVYALRSKENYHLLNDLRNHPAIDSFYIFGDYLHITLKQGGISGLEVELRNKYQDLEIKKISPGIEDCFIRLMK